MRRGARELQWRAVGRRYARARAGRDGFPHAVARHATPLFRELAGLSDELQRNKVVNLRLAAARLDGLVIAPGQLFSFWLLVGKPTYRRGFVDGAVLSHGRVLAGVGGGLCQSTNLLYWMTLHSPLTVVERWRHSYDVFPDASRTQPFGSGATCAWPALDLQVLNDTASPFRLGLEVTGGELRGEWRSADPCELRYEVYETGHAITHDGPGRYTRHNEVWRRVRDARGVLVADHLVARNDALMMYEPFLPAPAADSAS